MKIDENNTILDDTKVNEVAVALAATRLLDDHAQYLNAVTLQKLANARNQAVSQLAAKQAGGLNQSGNVLQWFGGAYFEQHKIMVFGLLMSAVLLAFLAAQQLLKNEQHSTVVSYQESSDAFLLASELPPEAFADKGFDTWVVSKQN